MPITDWPAEERPREKLLLKGAAALSDAELLAIFLRVGLPGKSAVDLARDLLNHFGSLTTLFNASLAEFSTIPGMGEAKYAQLQAVLEMSKRALLEGMVQKQVFTTPKAVSDYLRLWLGSERRELFGALFLDSQHQLIAAETLFFGTVDQAAVHPREVIRRCIAHNASALIIAHNHPSGSLVASQADIRLTQRLQAALNLIDVNLLDHFIVTAAATHSLAEHGQLSLPSVAEMV